MKNLAHERFIEEMMQHGNRVPAYQAAYPGAKAATAATCASRLLKQPHIKARLDEHHARLMEKAEQAHHDITLAETHDYLALQNELYRIIDESVEEITDETGQTKVNIKDVPAILEAALMSSRIRAGFLKKHPAIAAI
jgi:phage terminase small subunit